MTVRSIVCVASLALAVGSLSACDKKDEGATAGGAAGATEKAAVLADEDLPVAADFAEEAEGEISGDNYKAKLDELEKDIDKE